MSFVNILQPMEVFVPSPGLIPLLTGDRLPRDDAQRTEILRERREILLSFAATINARLEAGQEMEPLEAVGALLLRKDLAESAARAGLGTILRDVATQPAVFSGRVTSKPDKWHLDTIGWTDSCRQDAGTGILVGVLDNWLVSHPGTAPAVACKAFGKNGAELTHPDAIPDAHGTAMTSLIAGHDVGVAPQCQIVFASALRQHRSGRWYGTTPQVFYGLDWLGKTLFPTSYVRVMNLSFGIASSPECSQLTSALLGLNITIVAATGNHGGGPVNYPASIEGVFSVAATDQTDEMAHFSAFDRAAKQPELVAPGVGVTAANRIDSYARMAGTSIAAALVSGAAAAILGSNSKWGNTEVRESLRKTAESLQNDFRLNLAGHCQPKP